MFVFNYWSDTESDETLLYISAHMCPRPFLSRIKYALRYLVFGEADIGHWYEVLLDKHDTERMIKFLTEAVESMESQEDNND